MGISSASIECAGYAARTTLRGNAGFVMERQTIAEFDHACAPGVPTGLPGVLKNVLLSLAPGSGKFHE